MGFGRVEFASNQDEPWAVSKEARLDAGIDRSYVGGLERQEENPTVDLLDAKALSSRPEEHGEGELSGGTTFMLR